MAKKTDIPEDLEKSYKKMLQNIPMELRDDESIQASLLVYLKLGGEKLARQSIEITKKRFIEEFNIIKKYLRIEAEQKISDEDNLEKTDDSDDSDDSEVTLPED